MPEAYTPGQGLKWLRKATRFLWLCTLGWPALCAAAVFALNARGIPSEGLQYLCLAVIVYGAMAEGILVIIALLVTVLLAFEWKSKRKAPAGPADPPAA